MATSKSHRVSAAPEIECTKFCYIRSAVMTAVSGSASFSVAASPGAARASRRLVIFLGILAAVLILTGLLPLVFSLYLSQKYAGLTLPGVRVVASGAGGAALPGSDF